MKRITTLIAILTAYAIFVAGFTFAHNRIIEENINNKTIKGEISENIQDYKLGADPCPPPPPPDNLAIGADPCPPPPPPDDFVVSADPCPPPPPPGLP